MVAVTDRPTSSGFRDGHRTHRIMSMLMNIKRISQVFSRRKKTKLESLPPLSHATRARVIQYFMDSFAANASFYGGNPAIVVSVDIRKSLLLLLGRHQLDPKNPLRFFSEENATDDLLQFLHWCPDDNFFDFMELIFPTYMENMKVSLEHPPNDLISAFNHIFEMEGDSYKLTKMHEVRHSVSSAETSPTVYPAWIGATRARYTIEYPKIIYTSDPEITELSISPALTALGEGTYAIPNQEFRKALEHQRKGQYTDSIRESCRALESVLKVLCAQNRSNQDHNRLSLSQLIESIFEDLELDASFKQDIQHIGTIRNRYSNAHGGGENPRQTDINTSEYILTKTAALITFLVKSQRN